VSEEGRTPAEKNVEKIKDWNRFETKTDVRGFIQLAGFFRMYIRNFATIAEPLFCLLRKNAWFQWTDSQISAVEVLKRALTSEPIFQPLDYTAQEDRPLIVNGPSQEMVTWDKMTRMGRLEGNHPKHVVVS
jgi:hypothetical protein